MGKANVKVMAAGALFAAAVAAVLALCAPNAAWAIDEREPNDTYNTAQQITLGTTIYGSASYSYLNITPENLLRGRNGADPDFFVINVPANTTYRFYYCNDDYGSNGVSFWFYNRYYENIAYFYTDELRPKSDTVTLKSGINYIYVRSGNSVWDTDAVQYHFKLSPILTKTYIKKLTAARTAATLKWAKKLGTTQYQIRYSTKSSMSGAKVKSVSGSKTSLKVKKLKKNKKYYFQVRVVKNIQGKNFYSGWSVKKSIRTKR